MRRALKSRTQRFAEEWGCRSARFAELRNSVVYRRAQRQPSFDTSPTGILRKQRLDVSVSSRRGSVAPDAIADGAKEGFKPVEFRAAQHRTRSALGTTRTGRERSEFATINTERFRRRAPVAAQYESTPKTIEIRFGVHVLAGWGKCRTKDGPRNRCKCPGQERRAFRARAFVSRSLRKTYGVRRVSFIRGTQTAALASVERRQSRRRTRRGAGFN